MSKTNILKLQSIFIVLCGIGWAYYYYTKPPGDYANYYFGSKFFLKNISTEAIYDPSLFNEMIFNEGIKNIFADYAPVPPFSLLFFIPFTFFDIELSKILFNIISIVLFLLSFYRLAKLLELESKTILLSLLVILVPIRSNIVVGQTYLLLLSFLMEGYIFSIRRKQIASSFFFALPIALKIFPAILLLWLFFTDRKKEFWYTIFFVLVFFLIMIPFTGYSFIWNYISYHMPRLSAGEINDPYSVTFQSFTVLMRKLFVYDAFLNPSALIDLPLVFIFLNLLFCSLILIVSIQLFKKEKNNDLFTYGFTFLLGMIISGYGTNYSLVLLLFLAMSLIKESENKKSLIYFALMFCICSFPSYWFFQFPLFLQFGRLYLIIALFIFILLDKKYNFSIRYFIYAFPIMFSGFILNFLIRKDDSLYYLRKEPSLLISSFKPVKNGLLINYFSTEGKDSIFYQCSDTIKKVNNLCIKDNQIFFNEKQITFGRDLKKDVCLLNNGEALFLSDKDKGIGLYSLRKVKIKAVIPND
jgi:hypothetical protein